jgi:hypothetical protein
LMVVAVTCQLAGAISFLGSAISNLPIQFIGLAKIHPGRAGVIPGISDMSPCPGAVLPMWPGPVDFLY